MQRSGFWMSLIGICSWGHGSDFKHCIDDISQDRFHLQFLIAQRNNHRERRPPQPQIAVKGLSYFDSISSFDIYSAQFLKLKYPVIWYGYNFNFKSWNIAVYSISHKYLYRPICHNWTTYHVSLDNVKILICSAEMLQGSTWKVRKCFVESHISKSRIFTDTRRQPLHSLSFLVQIHERIATDLVSRMLHLFAVAAVSKTIFYTRTGLTLSSFICHLPFRNGHCE